MGGGVAEDPIDRMVEAACARVLAQRAAEEAAQRAERERRVEADRHLAEALLTRVRPVLALLAAALDRRIEGDWQVEWYSPEGGGFGLQLGSAAHPARLRVALDRSGRATLAHRADDYAETSAPSMALDRLEPELQGALQAWVEAVTASPYTRFRP